MNGYLSQLKGLFFVTNSRRLILNQKVCSLQQRPQGNNQRKSLHPLKAPGTLHQVPQAWRQNHLPMANDRKSQYGQKCLICLFR